MSLPVMKAMCSTCPFREGGWEHLQGLLVERAAHEGTPICHSTGEKALTKSLGPERICRGARDFQLKLFTGLGVIESPTEDAWEAACKRMGIKNIAEGATA